MKDLLFVSDIENPKALISEALGLKGNPFAHESLGRRKTLGLLFFNPSLRTRLSTQKAAHHLGMECIVMNVGMDGWQLELADGTQMNGNTSEHIKEAAGVVSQYCDIIGIRSFPSLTDCHYDEQEAMLLGFKTYAQVPIINLESATEHPLQALADAMTITANQTTERPKVVLSWAPHPKALPQSVANSFAAMMQSLDVDFHITHPPGYELNPRYSGKAPVLYNQVEALREADFVYAKNWSSYSTYGQVLETGLDWMLTQEKMDLTNSGKFMHCLPVRRNIIVEDAVLDSSASLVIAQAHHRTYAAQVILKNILQS